jgi:hypothetical protein
VSARSAIAALACAAAFVAAPVAAQPNPGSFYVHGSVGLATESMDDWRAYIDGLKQAFPDWRNIGTAFGPAGEVGYVVNRYVSLGVRLAHQRGTSSNAYADLELMQSQRIRVSMDTWTVNASVWLPNVKGLYIGGDVGSGRGAVDYEAHVHRNSDPAADRDQSARWTGNGFVAGLFVGYQQRMGEHGFWFYRGSWRTADLGVFDGRIVDEQFGSATGPPAIGNKTFDTDFSGIGVAFGFGLSIGGQPDGAPDPAAREARIR